MYTQHQMIHETFTHNYVCLRGPSSRVPVFIHRLLHDPEPSPTPLFCPKASLNQFSAQSSLLQQRVCSVGSVWVGRLYLIDADSYVKCGCFIKALVGSEGFECFNTLSARPLGTD